MYNYLVLDVPECDRGFDSCHQNATCFNTLGSFGCMCNTGFTGNGFTCTGNLPNLFQAFIPSIVSSVQIWKGKVVEICHVLVMSCKIRLMDGTYSNL